MQNNNKKWQRLNKVFFSARDPLSNDLQGNAQLSKGQLRNGWWIVIFIALVALTRPLYKPLQQQLLAWGTPSLALEYLSPALVLLVTWICLRLRRQRLADVGLRLNRSWLTQFSAGLLIATIQIGAITALIYAAGGLSFSLNPQRSVEILLSGACLMLAAVVLEELLFRGFLFQRLLDGTGVWFSQIVLALLFAFGHWDNPGMDGITKLVASVDLALGALIFGFAYIRTRSLALPIGLHLGWNYSQGMLLGFAVSGHEHTSWFTPTINDGASWLNGGQFGLEASIFAVIIDLLLLTALWRWRGSNTQTTSKTSAELPAASLAG